MPFADTTLFDAPFNAAAPFFDAPFAEAPFLDAPFADVALLDVALARPVFFTACVPFLVPLLLPTAFDFPPIVANACSRS